MITNKRKLEFIWKKATENLNEDAFRSFLCYAWGCLGGNVTTGQVELLQKQFEHLLKNKENRRAR